MKRDLRPRITGRIGRIACFAVLLAAGPGVVSASADSAAEERLRRLEEQVRVMQREIQSLRKELAERDEDGEARVKEMQEQVLILTDELEKGRLGDAFAPPGESRFGLGPSASKVYEFEGRGVSIGGYGEMLYENFDSSREDGEPSGKTDQIDFLRAVLYFGYKFNDRILFNSEIEFEHASTGKSGEVSVEFAYLDFFFKDMINARAGLVLVPVGLINEMHEPTTFLGAKRPGVARSIIPTTWRENGAGIFGEKGLFSYRAYVTAGLDASGFSAKDGLRGGRQKGSKSLIEDPAITARFDFRPVDGLLVGVSGFTGDSSQGATTPSGESFGGRVNLYDIHLDYRWKALEFRALWSGVDIDDVEEINELNGLMGDDSVGSRLEGWYAHLGYDVLSHAGTDQELIPYVLYEAFNTQVEVPAGFAANPANDRRIWTFGLAYRPIPNVVVKVDWQDVGNEADTGVDQFNVALGYNF